MSFGFCEGVVTPDLFLPPTHGVNVFGLSSVKLQGLFFFFEADCLITRLTRNVVSGPFYSA